MSWLVVSTITLGSSYSSETFTAVLLNPDFTTNTDPLTGVSYLNSGSGKYALSVSLPDAFAAGFIKFTASPSGKVLLSAVQNDAAGARAEIDANSTKLDVAVSTRLAPTTAGRTLDVAATGEAGVDLSNIKQAAAPTTLDNITVPTVTDLTNSPTIDASDVAAAVVAGLGGSRVVVRAPVLRDGTITVIRRDDYKGTRALQFTATNYTGPDLSTGEAFFRAMPKGDYEHNTGAADISLTGDVAVTTETDASITLTLTFDLAAEDTQGVITIPFGGVANYEYQAGVTVGGDTISPFRGLMSVERDVL